MVKINWKHVKGHSGNQENEGADRLASAATEKDEHEDTAVSISPSRLDEKTEKPGVTEDTRKNA